MAGPISHIVFALKILCLLPPTINKQEFLIGTSFPDIRYMCQLPREQTHIEPISWSDIINEPSSFRAGMLFHNLVDILRMKYFEPHFFDRFCQPQCTDLYWRLYPLILKLSEDAVLYNMVYEWPEIMRYFGDICQEETALCSNTNIIHQWHTALKNYFKQSPNIASVVHLLSQDNMFLLNHQVELNIKKLFDDFLNNKDFHTKLMQFYDTFESLLPEKPVSTPLNKQHVYTLCIA